MLTFYANLSLFPFCANLVQFLIVYGQKGLSVKIESLKWIFYLLSRQAK